MDAMTAGARALVVLGCLGLGACSGFQPTDYDPDHRHDPEMSGVFTGKEGEFVIFRRKQPQTEPASTQAGANKEDDAEQPRK